jgi:hypothetical protein
MFVRNCWYVAAWSHELTETGFTALSIANEPLLVYRTANGDVVVLEDRCCHRQAPLSLGRREGDAIRCMYHVSSSSLPANASRSLGRRPSRSARECGAIPPSTEIAGSGSGWVTRPWPIPP